MPNAAINTASSGDNIIVTAVTAKRIRVRGYAIMGAGVVNVSLKSSGGTALTGPFPLAAQAGLVCPVLPFLPGGPDGWFDTQPGEGLVLNLSTGVQVSGHVNYTIVT